jgi:hypothetical protein
LSGAPRSLAELWSLEDEGITLAELIEFSLSL